MGENLCAFYRLFDVPSRCHASKTVWTCTSRATAFLETVCLSETSVIYVSVHGVTIQMNNIDKYSIVLVTVGCVQTSNIL